VPGEVVDEEQVVHVETWVILDQSEELPAGVLSGDGHSDRARRGPVRRRLLTFGEKVPEDARHSQIRGVCESHPREGLEESRIPGRRWMVEDVRGSDPAHKTPRIAELQAIGVELEDHSSGRLIVAMGKGVDQELAECQARVSWELRVYEPPGNRHDRVVGIGEKSQTTKGEGEAVPSILGLVVLRIRLHPSKLPLRVRQVSANCLRVPDEQQAGDENTTFSVEYAQRA
jgi:hypothetical protein